MKPITFSFNGLLPASPTASRVARANSRKRDTKPELLLRQALWSRGLRYRVDVSSLPGRPDVVFSTARLVIFCDGDFWHGRDLRRRVAKLAVGHNAPYWISKIKGNVDRDRRIERMLLKSGWGFMRFWESDVCTDPELAADKVLRAVRVRRRIQKPKVRNRKTERNTRL